MRIKHITLRVKDLEKSIKFYEEMTELKVDRSLEAGPANLVFMKSGENQTEIELLHIENDETFSGKGMFICFECDKIDEMHKFAEKKSYNPSPIQDPGDGSKYFYVYDPDGVSIQLRTFK